MLSGQFVQLAPFIDFFFFFFKAQDTDTSNTCYEILAIVYEKVGWGLGGGEVAEGVDGRRGVTRTMESAN